MPKSSKILAIISLVGSLVYILGTLISYGARMFVWEANLGYAGTEGDYPLKLIAADILIKAVSAALLCIAPAIMLFGTRQGKDRSGLSAVMSTVMFCGYVLATNAVNRIINIIAAGFYGAAVLAKYTVIVSYISYFQPFLIIGGAAAVVAAALYRFDAVSGKRDEC